MSKRLEIGIAAALAVLSVSGIIYLSSMPKVSTRSVYASDAIRMFAGTRPTPDPEHELRALETSLKQNPDHVPILLRMAQVQKSLGKTTDAIAHLREAIEADGKNLEARLELGRSLFDSGDVEGAIQETEALIQIDPRNTDGLYNLGAIYGNLGMEERASEYWKKAVSIDPNSESGRRASAALAQLGR